MFWNYNFACRGVAIALAIMFSGTASLSFAGDKVKVDSNIPMYEKVSGISVPEHVRRRMHGAEDPPQEGIRMSRELLREARALFAGACLMPPFGHYEIVGEILRS